MLFAYEQKVILQLELKPLLHQLREACVSEKKTTSLQFHPFIPYSFFQILSISILSFRIVSITCAMVSQCSKPPKPQRPETTTLNEFIFLWVSYLAQAQLGSLMYCSQNPSWEIVSASWWWESHSYLARAVDTRKGAGGWPLFVVCHTP